MVRIAAIKGADVIGTYIYDDMAEAQKFFERGAFGTADSFVKAPDEVQLGWGFEDGEFIRPPEPPPQIAPVSLEESVQATMYLTATLDILMAQGGLGTAGSVSAMAGRTSSTFATQSPRYDFWRFSYFRQHTNLFTLDKLVEGGILTRDEVDGMVADRIKEYGV